MVSGSAEAICLSARTAVQGAAHPQLHRVRCEFENGIVRLEGRVASFYLKQVAQHLVGRAVPSSVAIDNRLEVG